MVQMQRQRHWMQAEQLHLQKQSIVAEESVIDSWAMQRHTGLNMCICWTAVIMLPPLIDQQQNPALLVLRSQSWASQSKGKMPEVKVEADP